MVAEGLNGLVREVEAKELLEGVKTGNGNLEVSLLQFTNDTFFFFRDDMKETLTIKAILRCFELASSLKVNFYKSSLTGIQVTQREINRYAIILNCTTMMLPFTYLGLPMGERMLGKLALGNW